MVVASESPIIIIISFVYTLFSILGKAIGRGTKHLNPTMESLTIFSLYFCPLALFIFILFFKHHLHPPLLTQKPRQRLTPPGPRQFPVIGNIPHLLLASHESQLPHHCFRSLSQTYGPLLHLKLGQMSLVVASTPEAAREVMKTHDVLFSTRPLFTAIKIFSYDGQSMSFAPYGEYWRQLRRICILELLSPKRIQSFRSIREEEVQNLIQSIYSYSREDECSIVNLSKELSSLTNNIMARAAVGSKYCEDQMAFLAALEEGFEISGGFPLEDMFPSWSWLIGLVSGFKGKLERCHRNFDQILDGIIQKHKIKMKKSTATRESKEVITAGSSYSGKQEEVEDLLDLLLRLQEDGGLEFELTTVRIKAVILDILGAGTETSSTVLVWAVSELMRNPEVMRRAQSEVREVLQGNNKVTEEDIKELNYLQLVIKETLRLHPPAPLLLPRECQETCEVLGYEIPEKARVVINVWAMGRDPQYWEDAEKFNPDRFEGNHIDFKGANFEFLPFGSGRRMCPGMMFGLATVELALAQLLYYFNWELPNGNEPRNLDMSESFGVSARRKSNLCLRCHPYIPGYAAAAQGL